MENDYFCDNVFCLNIKMRENVFDNLLQQLSSGPKVPAGVWRALLAELDDVQKGRLALLAREV